MAVLMHTERLAELLGITVRRLHQLVGEGVAVKTAPGEFDAGATVRNMLAAASRKGEAKSADTAMSIQKERLAREQADAIAAKNARLRGELVPAAEVERRWSDVLRRIRSGVLAVPARVRQSCPHFTARDVTTIDGELRRVLDDLAGPADA